MADDKRANADDRRSSRNGNERDGGAGKRSGGGRSNRSNRLSAREAVQRVRQDFPALLGRPVESVLGVQSDDNQGWEVTVQVVELARIPNTTDVLGAYEVTLDEDGELAGYRRRRRYTRNQADED